MQLISEKYQKFIVPVVAGIILFLFWAFGHSEILCFQEQNQLFLFSDDYLTERLVVAGGLADYLSEFIVQFYYYPVLGALLLSALFVGLQQLLQYSISRKFTWSSVFISSMIVVLMQTLMADMDHLLSFDVAVVLTVVSWKCLCRTPLLVDLFVIPLGYWFLGPVFWIYVLVRAFSFGWKGLFQPLFMVAVQVVCYELFLQQWPFISVFFGINYFRIPLQSNFEPFLVYVPLLIASVLIVASHEVIQQKLDQKKIAIASSVVFFLFSGIMYNVEFDAQICELLKMNQLVREENWDEIISRNEKQQVPVNYSCECLNLALSMRHQLADRMFTFYQSGSDALVMPSVRDNMSDIPTAEVYYRIGLVNSCLRYFSDLQESILNGRKSGRFEQRIAECYLVNGNYLVARKHLDLLKKSLFYRSWAEDTETYLNNEQRIASHPVWGQMRKFRLKVDCLYIYEMADKMFGQLFADNTSNSMALDYFLGQMLLNGNWEQFSRYVSWAQQYGGYSVMPSGYQDAMNAISNGPDTPGSAYALYVKRMMSNHGN